MKKFGILLGIAALLSLAWMGFVRQPLPPVPEISRALSDRVNLNFSINAMDYTGVELSLKDRVGGKGMYVQFKMANAWRTGRPGLVVTGIRGNSAFRNGMSPKSYLNDQKRKAKGGKDFSDFMKDKRGNAVSSYSFQQMLVEGKDGKTYMQMSYNGPAMEMIQTLEIPRPITIPGYISRKFTSDGVIQFRPGTVAFDNKIKGFYIPVTIR